MLPSQCHACRLLTPSFLHFFHHLCIAMAMLSLESGLIARQNQVFTAQLRSAFMFAAHVSNYLEALVLFGGFGIGLRFCTDFGICGSFDLSVRSCFRFNRSLGFGGRLETRVTSNSHKPKQTTQPSSGQAR
jgi:hypothetical protein